MMNWSSVDYDRPDEAVPRQINLLQPVDERKEVVRRRCACKKVSDAKVRKIDKGEQWE